MSEGKSWDTLRLDPGRVREQAEGSQGAKQWEKPLAQHQLRCNLQGIFSETTNCKPGVVAASL